MKTSMQTLGIGISTDRRRSRPRIFRPGTAGFSLIELLVVVTIIGVFAGAAVLSLGVLGSDRELEREAFRFRSLLDLLTEEAVMESRDYGIMFSERAYRFYVYDRQQQLWIDPIGDYFLSEHQLEEPLSMALFMEERDIVLDPEVRSRPPGGARTADSSAGQWRSHPVRDRVLSRPQRRSICRHRRVRWLTGGFSAWLRCPLGGTRRDLPCSRHS